MLAEHWCSPRLRGWISKFLALTVDAFLFLQALTKCLWNWERQHLGLLLNFCRLLLPCCFKQKQTGGGGVCVDQRLKSFLCFKKKKKCRGGAEPVTSKCCAFLSHLYTCVNDIRDSRPTTFRTTLHPSREGILVPHWSLLHIDFSSEDKMGQFVGYNYHSQQLDM